MTPATMQQVSNGVLLHSIIACGFARGIGVIMPERENGAESTSGEGASQWALWTVLIEGTVGVRGRLGCQGDEVESKAVDLGRAETRQHMCVQKLQQGHARKPSTRKVGCHAAAVRSRANRQATLPAKTRGAQRWTGTHAAGALERAGA
jgi:hypothetical protein